MIGYYVITMARDVYHLTPGLGLLPYHLQAQAGIELGLNNAETVSLELASLFYNTSWPCNGHLSYSNWLTN